MSHGGSEPSGLCGLRKQVTEAKEGPLELRKKSKHLCARGKERGKGVGMLERERGKGVGIWTVSLVLSY